MSEISIFADESGGQGGRSKYYALTLVFHDRSDDIMGEVGKYRRGLATRGLEDIPLHEGPLLTGHDSYEGMDIKDRKGYRTMFFQLLQHLPIRYATFVYRRSELVGDDAFVSRMRRDIVDLVFDNLEYFQAFDEVKVYYDNGQEIVAEALRGAIEYAISKDSLLYRKTAFHRLHSRASCRYAVHVGIDGRQIQEQGSDADGRQVLRRRPLFQE